MKNIARPAGSPIVTSFIAAVVMLLSWTANQRPLVNVRTGNNTDTYVSEIYRGNQMGWHLRSRLFPTVLTGNGSISSVAAMAAKPISVDTVILEPDWTVEGDEPGSHIGRSVANAGDVNGDGYGDVIVGASSYRNNMGRAFVYYGSADGPDKSNSWSAQGAQANNNFGSSVASAGDINNDGYSDVIIGESGFDRSRGRVFVYYGSATGLGTTPNWSMEGNAYASSSSTFGGGFGGSAASAGDVNHDGFDDIIIGEPGYFSLFSQIPIGRAYLYYGSAAGIGNTAAWVTQGTSLDYFGSSVASAGDVNADGFSDVIIGAPTDRLGYAVVFNGSDTGLNRTPSWRVNGPPVARFVYFGQHVSGAGDVNGDGFSDLIIGATGCFCNPSPSLNFYGGVYLYLGSASGAGLAPSWTLISDNPGVGLGNSVASAGDFNKDGYADVIVGEPLYANKGLALLYYGSSSGLNNNSFSVAGPGKLTNSNFGYSVASAGDVNNDKYSDIIIGIAGDSRDSLVTKGLASVYHGKMLLQTPLPLRLLHFNARYLDNEVALEWATANETNTPYFEVQRSVEGNSFSSVTKVNAKGASGGNALYTYDDRITITDKMYYRLKWIDMNGKPAYSNVVFLRNNMQSFFDIHPNLLSGGQPLLVSINNKEGAQQGNLQVVDINGRIVRVFTLKLTKGYQTFTLNAPLNKGNYFVNLTGFNQRAEVKKVMVQ